MKSVWICAAFVAFGGLMACGEEPQAEDRRLGGELTPVFDDPDIGLIEMALETVPAEISCVRIKAKGPYREKAIDVPVVPGPAMVQTLGGFPLGHVVLAAEAFGAACSSVTTKTVAAWVSDPVEVSIVEGTKTRVAFTMQRNGRVDVALNFADEPACTAAGIVCKSVRECCSNACKDGVCQP